MKTITTIITLFSFLQAQAQLQDSSFYITHNKTSSIIFPAAIKSVDRGSRDVLVQKATGINNVLFVKAGQQAFEETNLTVITADGKLYQLTVNYASDPHSFLREFREPTQIQPVTFEEGLTETDLAALYKSALSAPRNKHHLAIRKHAMKAALTGVYIHNHLLLWRIQLTNKSNISFEAESFNTYIRDKSRLKRTASQEIELNPLYPGAQLPEVAGKETSEYIIALRKFTIPDAKRLHMEIMERNGGRHLQLTIKNRHLMRAAPLMLPINSSSSRMSHFKQ